jgi:hypothetical protein
MLPLIKLDDLMTRNSVKAHSSAEPYEFLVKLRNTTALQKQIT